MWCDSQIICPEAFIHTIDALGAENLNEAVKPAAIIKPASLGIDSLIIESRANHIRWCYGHRHKGSGDEARAEGVICWLRNQIILDKQRFRLAKGSDLSARAHSRTGQGSQGTTPQAGDAVLGVDLLQGTAH